MLDQIGLFSQYSLGYAAKIENVSIAISSSVNTSFSWEFIVIPPANTSLSTSVLDKKDPPGPCDVLNRAVSWNISWLFCASFVCYVLPTRDRLLNWPTRMGFFSLLS